MNRVLQVEVLQLQVEQRLTGQSSPTGGEHFLCSPQSSSKIAVTAHLSGEHVAAHTVLHTV